MPFAITTPSPKTSRNRAGSVSRPFSSIAWSYSPKNMGCAWGSLPRCPTLPHSDPLDNPFGFLRDAPRRRTLRAFDCCGALEREDRGMTEAAAPIAHRQSRWGRAWHALLGRDELAPPVRDDSISFAELVWAHHRRQEALGHDDELDADDLY